MPWVEIFAVLVVSHLAGDFLAQTEWQAQNKYGGLGHRAESRRALRRHVLSYTLCFLPAFAWLLDPLGWAVCAVAALVAVPHLVQDDGRLLTAYLRRVKHSDANPGDPVYTAVDQSLHLLTLFAIALLAAAV
jgi:Protein of unknown function (DUF3307)